MSLSSQARELYSRFDLKPEQSEVIVGSLFGDASLLWSRKDRVPNFYENHAMGQIDYLNWKAAMLGKPDGVKIRLMTHGYSRGKLIPYFQFRDRALLGFGPLFYMTEASGRRKKVVTKEGLELLVGSPLPLAVFYQDDGEYNYYSNRSILHTSDFTMQENEMMATRFRELLGANVRVGLKRKRYPTLLLSSMATDRFIEIVKPFVHKSMLYKIDQNIAHHIDRAIAEKLIREYGKKPAKQIAHEVDLTIKEIYVIAYRLHLTERVGYIRYRKVPLIDDEKRYLVQNYRKIPTRDIAKKLNTSPDYIQQLAMKLGLTRGTSKKNHPP